MPPPPPGGPRPDTPVKPPRLLGKKSRLLSGPLPTNGEEREPVLAPCGLGSRCEVNSFWGPLAWRREGGRRSGAPREPPRTPTPSSPPSSVCSASGENDPTGGPLAGVPGTPPCPQRPRPRPLSSLRARAVDTVTGPAAPQPTAGCPTALYGAVFCWCLSVWAQGNRAPARELEG